MSILAKVVYSALLVGVTIVVLRELWMVWLDKKIYVGRFTAISDTGTDDATGASFPARVVSAQAILARQYHDYQQERSADSPTDATFILPGMTPLSIPPEALSGIDITVQNVNLRQLFTTLRKYFLAPNEITGNVMTHEGLVVAAVDWPRAPQLGENREKVANFLVPGQKSPQDAAAYIASSLSWARAARLDDKVAEYPRVQFCDFCSSLNDRYALAEKASGSPGLDANDVNLIRKRARQLRSHYEAAAVFPELYRIRADLLDLVPEKDRTSAELVESQDDRLSYAMLSPGLRELQPTEKRLVALALARPAILLQAGKLVEVKENWSKLLRPHEAEIVSAANSVGMITHSNGIPAGTGFVVAPGLMLTADHVLEACGYAFERNGDGRVAKVKQHPATELRLGFGIRKAPYEPSLIIGDVVYLENGSGSRVVLANLIDHDAVLQPPLVLSERVSPPSDSMGNYAYVLGYPFRDGRMPKEFSDRLLADKDGCKRVMPGRILALGQTASLRDIGLEFATSPAPAIFTTDISTSVGTAGGPLVDLATGRVVGMSFAGRWQSERGKMSYSEPFPQGVLEIIRRRIRGEELKPLESSTAEQVEPAADGATG